MGKWQKKHDEAVGELGDGIADLVTKAEESEYVNIVDIIGTLEVHKMLVFKSASDRVDSLRMAEALGDIFGSFEDDEDAD